MKWKPLVLMCVRDLCKNKKSNDFSLDEIYMYQNDMREYYPENYTIESKIRQTLQDLRDDGLVNFIDNKGSYRLEEILNFEGELNFRPSMNFRNSLEKVSVEYISSISENFTNHELANFIRQQFPTILRHNSNIPDNYKLVGSPGKGNWAEIPWLCIFDKEITISAQHGYYLVYLFDSRMETVSLCLSLGWTQFENQYGIKEGKVRIRQKAKFFQEYLTNRTFSSAYLDLNSNRILGKGYELGCILKKTYRFDKLPSNSILMQDLWSLIGIYEELKYRIGEDVLLAETGFYRDQYEIEDEISDVVKKQILAKPKGQQVPTKKLLAGTTSFVPDLEVKAFVLQHANGVCEFCDMQAPFVTTKGRPYLDIHHVKWRSEGGSDKVENAIAVCPNCHMRFHHSEDKDKILEEVYNKIDRLVRE